MPISNPQESSPRQIIERAPLPEGPSFEQPDFEREGSQTSGEYAESNFIAPGPEMPGHFNPAPIADMAVSDESKVVEGILSDGLDDLYLGMMPDDQMKFKMKGEETVSLIVRMLHEPKVRIKKILELIRDWLRMIPGVNKFFLQQTAKIKTDRIVATITDKKIV